MLSRILEYKLTRMAQTKFLVFDGFFFFSFNYVANIFDYLRIVDDIFKRNKVENSEPLLFGRFNDFLDLVQEFIFIMAIAQLFHFNFQHL